MEKQTTSDFPKAGQVPEVKTHPIPADVIRDLKIAG